ncbi:phenylacetate-CoA ligase [Herbinix hemicellulosilytica]|uniref:Phenylacetate-coenzyme A ligase n=1 Tax=Herbinix hemicellulosilytica TaxID=1564487 RepID=A0A0H5SIR3_HERHM|nr:phenylacetate--CoA ligase [Herbinix hemicellulosilytica]RBP58813.1 phenylacetate-CoA ligase [Herbinix hemicellulosilytica]CRZ34980.1 Phenylacetate-coenzyme A ligase [Herbinix hemicellulosilytica]
MIWAKEETLPRQEIENIQFTRLKETLKRVYEKVPAYRKKMEQAGISCEDIKDLKDLKKLPFTTKQDLRDNYPFGLFTVPKKDLVRIHASSGTTGKPTVVGYTRKDLQIWTECVSRIACMGGATSEDIAQICFGYGMFTGALGLHYGLENIGAVVCPASAGNTKKQIMYMQDFGTTLLVATPSYALHIAEVAREMGLDPEKDLNVRIGLFGGEGMSEAMRSEMHRLWGSKMTVTQNYGMSELMGPGVSGECLELCGMHINEDHFIPEIIDPDTGEVLPPGAKGELVITCITKEALPLIRYRTRDITRLFYEPCKCGRTTVRMESLSGRSDDMLIIRGVNVFPSQIEEVLFKVPEIGAHYEIVVDRKDYLDFMEIKVELADESLLDSYAKLGELEKRIKSNLRTVLGLDAAVKLVAPRSLKRFEGKAKRVTDLRKM